MIYNGNKIQLYYTLTVEGQVIKSNKNSAPLEYIFGSGTLPSFLEARIASLEPGQRKTIVFNPEEAYGARDPKAILEVPRPEETDATDFIEGKTLRLENKENGQVMAAKILKVKKDSLVLDMNHPFAGKTLQYDVEIIAVEK